VPSLTCISALCHVVQSIQDLEKQRDTGMRANATATFKNNEQEQQLKKEGKLNRELNNGLVKANTAIEALVETILTSLNSSQENFLVASGQAVQESQRKDQEIKKLEDLREADAQELRDEKIAAVKELEEKHKQNTEAAHKKSGEALKAEFDKGKEVGEKDESIKNKAKTKEDNKKANEHQQEIARQAAKEKKEEQEKKEKEHKTEVDKLSKEKTSIAAAAGVVREKLAQVEAKVETLSEEKVVPSFVAVSHSIAPVPLTLCYSVVGSVFSCWREKM